MSQRTNRWPASVLSVMLYTLMFIFAHHFWASSGAQAVGGQPELLLFLLPGIVVALLRPESPLKSTLWVAVAGTVLGTLWVVLALNLSHSGWLIIWGLSALFWAGCGALLVRLLRIMLAMRS
ncbi:MAG: inner membrane protein YbjM [Pantoea sp.]|uniref:inner membrane protein YbjM n=1 Tax=unclassified Pantoea TaxID=2630326 RepID=UPI00238C7D57|nr:inner membrane protein YbjM [Pantoea sp.]MDE1185251.1 inner membrane protein YbjM [Pantoea sp.]